MAYGSELRRNHLHGMVTFLPAGPVSHRDFVTHAWSDNPIKDILVRMDDVDPRIQTGEQRRRFPQAPRPAIKRPCGSVALARLASAAGAAYQKTYGLDRSRLSEAAMLSRIFDDAPEQTRRKIAGMYAILVTANVGAWLWALVEFRGNASSSVPRSWLTASGCGTPSTPTISRRSTTSPAS